MHVDSIYSNNSHTRVWRLLLLSAADCDVSRSSLYILVRTVVQKQQPSLELDLEIPGSLGCR
jgi:hypothetical protein